MGLSPLDPSGNPCIINTACVHAELIQTATLPQSKEDISAKRVVTTMKDNKKLHISDSEKRDLQTLWDQAGERQYKCEKILLDNMVRKMF